MSLLKWVAVVVLGAGLGVAQAAGKDFTLSGVGGVSHSLKDYRGKWVVVNFWATWCPPCLEEIPDLIKFHEQHKDRDAVVVGMAYEDTDAKEIAGFVKKHGINYPVIQADLDVTQSLGDVPALPTTFMINPQGELVARQTGPITRTALESYIRRKSPGQAKHPGPPSVPPAVAAPSHGL